MKSTARTTLLALAVIIPVAAGHHSDASATEPETIDITFSLWISGNELSDADGDGVPELPILTGNEFVGVVFQKFRDSGVGTSSFADDSPPCGTFEVKGTDWTTSSFAMIVGRGGPVNATSYGSGLFPPERGFLQARDVIAAHACWYKVNGSNQPFVQTEYDTDTVGAIVIVTGEFRLADLF